MKTKVQLLWHAPFVLAVIFCLWPLLFMIATSFKNMDQIFQVSLNPISWPPTFSNYLVVLEDFPFLTYLKNTFFIAALVTLFKLSTSIFAAFAFVYYEFKGKEIVFNIMLLTFFLPLTVLIMPNYLLMSNLGLLNSPWGVIIPSMADGMGIFLMRQTMRGIPKSLFEAAILDNASPLNVLGKVVFPLVKSSALAIGIFFFINSWNEYFWPLLVLSDKDNYTLPLALQMFISSEGGSEWGIAMAVATLTSLPPLILYLFCQRFILNTFMQSGVKG